MRRDATRFPPPGRLVDVGGRRLHLHCVGEGTPTVILEAGGTSGILEYLDLQDAVAGVTRVCAYDRAGMGWSDDAPHALDAASLATDLEALLAAADVPGPYVVVAGSQARLTAELFARRHPDAVVGLLLLDALHSELLAAPSMDAGARALHRKATLAELLAHVGLHGLASTYDLDRHPEPRRGEARALKYHPRPWRRCGPW
ncbi:MAG: alpha/beta hydrolase [Alphaproteobacteria bacterium]|nr:alpha/beta hydrolase [Alphaproteobacteria bacterium]